MRDTLLNILSVANRQWRPIVFIYFIQLLFGLAIAVSAYFLFDDAIGNSLELDRLARGFDRSVFSDMVNAFPDLISSIQGKIVGALAIFLVLSIFLHAGLLSNIRKKEYSILSFLKGGRKYFIKFLLIAIIAMMKTLVSIAIIWLPFIKIIGDPLETFHSEKPFIQTILVLIIFTILVVSVIWLWSILSRIQIIDGSPLVSGMKEGWSKLKSKFWNYLMVAIALILLHILVMWIYTLIVDDWGAQSLLYLIVLVSIQQVFSLLRVWMRVLGYFIIDQLELD